MSSLVRFIAARYLFARNNGNVVNVITGIAIFGVAVGTMAMVVVLSVFSGLRTLNLQLTSSFDPDIRVTPSSGKTFGWPATTALFFETDPDIEAYTGVLEEKVFVSYRDRQTVARLKGVDSSFLRVNKLDSTVYQGRWHTSAQNQYTPFTVGYNLAAQIGMKLEDHLSAVRIYTLSSTADPFRPAQSVRQIEGYAEGFFYVVDKDDRYIFSDIEAVNRLLDTQNEVSSVEIRLVEGADPEKTAIRLQEKLGDDFVVKTREQEQAIFYRMMNIENVVLYAVFTLVLIIAFFNVIASLVMLIINKRDNILTLQRMGLTTNRIRRVFFTEGMYISFIGGGAGFVVGMVLVLLQQQYGLLSIGVNSDIPYPVTISAANIFFVVATVVVLGALSSGLSASVAVKRD